MIFHSVSTFFAIFLSIFTKLHQACLFSTSATTECFTAPTLNQYCFSDGEPFSGLPLPQDPFREIPPKFYLFERPGNSSTLISHSVDLDLSQGVIIIIHGWTGSFENTKVWHEPIIKNLFLLKPESQIIFVDWEEAAGLNSVTNPYDQPAANTRSIAAAVVDFLIENRNFSAAASHCIGFSLGSHVCGFAGKRFKHLGIHKYGWARITALDPAWPTFDVDNPNARVDSNDAEFVDAIHTSRLGLDRSIGDVDFYVGGGVTQPGCRWISGKRKRRNAIVDWFSDLVGCSHVRAGLIYAETIVNQPNYMLNGVSSDVTRGGSGSCTFAKFCPCQSQEAYVEDICPRECHPKEAHIIGYWSITRRHLKGDYFGDLAGEPPYCVEA